MYTLSNIEFEDGRKQLNHPYREWSPEVQYTNILEVHQIAVMRRELILKCYEDYYNEMPLTAYHETYSFMRLAMSSPWKSVDYVGYMWRKRITGCHHTEGKNGLPPSVILLRHQFNKLYQIA
ncbi:MAG: hypothetical protein CTY12_04700 [Methylotenera sp.]|nr:MAG: hypothetical protein CTY12_04700 [Methylotenera sp.]